MSLTSRTTRTLPRWTLPPSVQERLGRALPWDLLALGHPLPSLGTAAAAWLCGQLLAAALPRTVPTPEGWRLSLLFVMVLAQQGAISLHNDWCDRALDCVTKPHRALPSGRVHPQIVHRVAWGLAVLALLLAAPLGLLECVLCGLGLAAGWLYNARLKRTVWSWLPFVVAFPLIGAFGMAALGNWPTLWWTLWLVPLPAFIAIHLADALPDYEADRATGVRGLAQALGQRDAVRLAQASVLTATALTAAMGFAISTGLSLTWLAVLCVTGAAIAALCALQVAAKRPAWLIVGGAVCALVWVEVVVQVGDLAAHLAPFGA